VEELLFHPKTVHVPLGIAMVLPILALGVVVFARRFFRSTWLVIVALQAILAGSAFLAMNTGEREEERVEEVVGEEPVSAHEEAAEAFAWGSLAVLFLSAAALVPKERASRALAIVATLGAFVVLGLGVRTGSRGGELVYRHGAAEAVRKTAPPLQPSDREEDEEDESAHLAPR
jgi:uncharacterized membrane protein